VSAAHQLQAGEEIIGIGGPGDSDRKLRGRELASATIRASVVAINHIVVGQPLDLPGFDHGVFALSISQLVR